MPNPYTIGKAKTRLAAYHGDDAQLAAHIGMLLDLPEAEAGPILAAVVRLANTYPKMGILMAFSVIVAIGRELADSD
jgi:hypothetical protein